MKNIVISLNIALVAGMMSFNDLAGAVDACDPPANGCNPFNATKIGFGVGGGRTYNNFGKLVNPLGSMAAISGILNNYGLISNSYQFYTNNPSAAIINHPGGVIDVSYYFGIYSGKLDNYGIINFTPKTGEGQYYDYPQDELTISSNASFNNYGVVRISDTFAILSDGIFNNKGTVEITRKGEFRLGEYSSYVQTAGETIVNGILKGSNMIFRGGVLRGNGVINGLVDTDFSTTLSPGIGIGTLVIDSPEYSINMTENLDIEIGGSNRSQRGNDQLNVTGILNLSGTLNVLWHAGFIPIRGEKFTIITASGVIGTFRNVNLPQLDGKSWHIQYTPTSVILNVL